MAIEAINMLQLCTANFLYPWFLINLKLRSSSFRLHQDFSTLMDQMLFFPNSTGHWPQLQKGGYIYLSYDVRSGSDITPCNKIHKPPVVYRFSNIM